jgi:acyl-CoA reductase-like NAD-dependent aldehyde dehydrogenase
MTITTINPATGRTLATYDSHDDEQIEGLVERAHLAAESWGRQPLARRVEVITELARVLRARRAGLAELITSEMGKPLREAAGELEKSDATADFYAVKAAEILGDTKVDIDGVDAWVAREPVGLVLAVMPWNFPFWQALRFAIPALTAGNGVLLKHSPNVSGSALVLQELFEQAGLPVGVFTTLLVDEPRVPEVCERLVADDRVAAVTLTGSNRAGSAVGAAAGRAVKRSVLELGGSDAFVVLADADVEAAAASALRARFMNAGQSCVCAKRFVVEAPVAEQFTEALVSGAAGLVVGDPTDEKTEMGPIAREDLRTVLGSQVERSVAAGAVLLTGGRELPGEGFFFEPTVMAVSGPGVAAFDEETFGPVATITVAADEDEAVRLANATRFGLGLSVWTRDTTRGVAFARRVDSGAAFINAMVASDARLPFGGTKSSGYGRELSAEGMLEFVNTRTYWSCR